MMHYANQKELSPVVHWGGSLFLEELNSYFHLFLLLYKISSQTSTFVIRCYHS